MATNTVTSIEDWWKRMGSKRYPDATELFITADAGGSNGYRSRIWKFELQRFADKLDFPIHVSHFPPGTSKWNKIEHRLFSFISINWRGRPCVRSRQWSNSLAIQLVVQAWSFALASIGASTRKYPTGRKVSAEELRALNIERDDFHGDWNYVIRPRRAPS